VPSLAKSVTIGGLAISGNIVRSDDGEMRESVTLAAGTAGTLSTRTDNDTADISLTAGHGLTSGTYDIFWGSGATAGVRRGMTGTVSSNTLSLDGGAGDNLPIATTAVVVCKVVVVIFAFTGDNVLLAAVCAQYRSSVSFQQAGGTVIKNLDLAKSGTNGEMWDWAVYGDVTNPFAGVSCGKVAVSNGNKDNSNVVKFGVVLNNV
jgi:hypothetical protein